MEALPQNTFQPLAVTAFKYNKCTYLKHIGIFVMGIFHYDCLVSGQCVGDTVLPFTADGLGKKTVPVLFQQCISQGESVLLLLFLQHLQMLPHYQVLPVDGSNFDYSILQ